MVIIQPRLLLHCEHYEGPIQREKSLYSLSHINTLAPMNYEKSLQEVFLMLI